MTQDQVQAYNMAIAHAIEVYSKGRGAIAALRIPFAVTVDNTGTTTKQEVVYDAD